MTNEEISESISTDDESSDAHLKGPIWFDPAKGNFLQFLGIVLITMGIPFTFFASSRPIGLVLCPLGFALYIVGRFANWYFWYRLQ